MPKVVIFGGTTEGRLLCEAGSKSTLILVYCVATPEGLYPVEHIPSIYTHVGRMPAQEMEQFLLQHLPNLVIDATHPYAQEASLNIAKACSQCGVHLLRLRRESHPEPDASYFASIKELIPWLDSLTGNIFVTTGSSSALGLTQLPAYQKRIWLRILPTMTSLKTCLELHYPPDHLICMQGPFSEELNQAMFRSTDAKILLTKDSGSIGGFAEKLNAARRLDMKIAILAKPSEREGASLQEALQILKELI